MSATAAAEDQVKHASKWGPLGFLALAVLVVAGGFAYAIAKSPAPEISVNAPDRWTGNDQIRFEATLAQRLEKQDRTIDRLDALIVGQVKFTDRLLVLLERQDDRIRSLEVNAAVKKP